MSEIPLESREKTGLRRRVRQLEHDGGALAIGRAMVAVARRLQPIWEAAHRGEDFRHKSLRGEAQNVIAAAETWLRGAGPQEGVVAVRSGERAPAELLACQSALTLLGLFVGQNGPEFVVYGGNGDARHVSQSELATEMVCAACAAIGYEAVTEAVMESERESSTRPSRS